jgi:hypothetical protein
MRPADEHSKFRNQYYAQGASQLSVKLERSVRSKFQLRPQTLAGRWLGKNTVETGVAQAKMNKFYPV